MELLMYRCYTGLLPVALVPHRLCTTLRKSEDSGSVEEDGCKVVDNWLRGETVKVRSSQWIAGIQ